MRRGAGLTAVGTVLCVPVVYLLALLVAATRRRQRPLATGAPHLRMLVIVPAHNEEAGLSRTLDSLAALDFPADACELMVIADNCTDATAAIARGCGVHVLERDEPARRGKGYAIAWALEHIAAEPHAVDAVVIVDADCTVSTNLLRVIEARMRDGAEAVQARYGVANPAASKASALRYSGYALMNTVRPMGKAVLGLSAGLYGSGMAFTTALLQRVPWSAASLVEDHEQHLRLVAAGAHVVFAPEAEVLSDMPTAFQRTSDQQLRWEQGRLYLAAAWTPRLVQQGLRERDRNRLHAGLELLVPPQSLLALGSVGVATVAAARGSRAARRVATAALAGQAIFVVGGLLVARAPAAAYRALVAAPLLIAQKLLLVARIGTGRGPTRFVRTHREESKP